MYTLSLMVALLWLFGVGAALGIVIWYIYDDTGE